MSEESGNEGDSSASGGKGRKLTRNEIARERWYLLARALLERSKSCPAYDRPCRIKKFESYGILKSYKLENGGGGGGGGDDDGYWVKYEGEVGRVKYSLKVFHLRLRQPPWAMMGFDNTGNVRIWPSEEVLAYYVLLKLPAFAMADALEIGGGMSCLAGLMLGTCAPNARVDVTDGNATSVENVRFIMTKNNLLRSGRLRCFRLDWTDYVARKKYDLVMCSDCVSDPVDDLVDVIWKSLRDDGIALVMAPNRCGMLESFVKKAQRRGFLCIKNACYDRTMWNLREKLKETCEEYRPDTDYPILVILVKSNAVYHRLVLADLVTDYWVSQERKFCEFCKCSISANKASIEFHENGKNHKENVAKRLAEIQKKAAKDARDALHLSNEMKRMEAAALKAYMKDMELNPDYTSQFIDKSKIEIPHVEEVPKKQAAGGKKQHGKNAGGGKPAKKWMEAAAEDGASYYWNTETGDSTWEVPEEGFVSLEEQKSRGGQGKAPKAKGPPAKFKKKPFKKGPKGKEKPARRREEAEAEEEEEKEKGKAEQALEEEFGPPIYTGHPLGKWQAVVTKEEKPIDLQLPEQEFVKIVVPSLKGDSDRKFKEKKISAPGNIGSAAGETAFKKRKFAAKNMRQRLDND